MTLFKKKDVFSIWKFLILFLLTLFLIFFYMNNDFFQESLRENISYVDILIIYLDFWIQKPYGYVMILVFLTYQIKKQFLIINIIQYDSRKAIWMRQLKECFLVALFLTITNALILLAISTFYKNPVYNWNVQDSFFHLFNVENFKLPFFLIFACLMVGYLLFFVSLMIVFLSTYWYKGNVIFSWILILVLHVLEKFTFEIDIYFGYASNNYIYWKENEVFKRLVILILMIYLVGNFGCRVASKKEFLDE